MTSDGPLTGDGLGSRADGSVRSGPTSTGPVGTDQPAGTGPQQIQQRPAPAGTGPTSTDRSTGTSPSDKPGRSWRNVGPTCAH